MRKFVYLALIGGLTLASCKKDDEIVRKSSDSNNVVNNDEGMPDFLRACKGSTLKNDSGPFSQSMSNLSEAIILEGTEAQKVLEAQKALEAREAFLAQTSYFTINGRTVCYHVNATSILQNQELNVGKAYYGGYTGSGKEFALIMQTDGNFVLYKNGTVVWSSGTWGYYGARCFMQGDGNLVIYDKSWKPIWSSGTQCSNARLIVSDIGIVIEKGGIGRWYKVF